jgi:hypothetical protein
VLLPQHSTAPLLNNAHVPSSSPTKLAAASSFVAVGWFVVVIWAVVAWLDLFVADAAATAAPIRATVATSAANTLKRMILPLHKSGLDAY